MIDVSSLCMKKLTQSKISSYFEGCRGIPKEEPSQFTKKRKMSGRVNRRCGGKRTQKNCDSSASSWVSSSSFSSVPKRKLVAPIFSEGEDSESENEQSTNTSNQINENNNHTIPTKKAPTLIALNKPTIQVKSPEKSLICWKPQCTSTPLVLHSEEFVSTDFTTIVPSFLRNINNTVNNSLPNINNSSETRTTDPCCSKTLTQNISTSNCRTTDPSCSKTLTSNISTRNVRSKNVDSATSDSDEGADENENNSRNIRILNNIVLQPPKVTPKKNTSMRETNVKDEDKKINFAYVDVMKDFFLNILNTNHLKCLLNNHQKDLLNKFFNIDRKYQYTCIKLYMWKPIWYNIFKYADRISLQMQDSEVVQMYNCLKNNGFVETNYLVEDLFTLLNLIGLKELREIQRSFKFTNSTNTRESIISKLLKNCKTQVTLTCTKSTEQVLRDRIQEKLGLCIKLSDQLSKALYNMYLLNTFTNSSVMKPQDYFKDLNIVFPDYQVENYHIFYTPEEFLQYASAVELRNALENAIEKKNTSHIFEICKLAHKMLKELNKNGSSFDTSRAPHLEKFTAIAQYVSILSTGVNHVPSSAYNDTKIWLEYLLDQKYFSCKRGHWYYHLSLIYTAYLREYETAAKLLISAFEKDKENLSEVQLHELAYRGKILDKRTYNLSAFFHDQIAILSPPSCDRDWPQTVVESRTMRSNEPGRKRKYVQQCENGDVNYLTVEQTALEHYRISGYPEGEHCEGSLICVAFCLLFWDIIYESYVKGTFVAKIQNVPLDMYTNYFYVNREHLIKMRLNQIRTNWKEEELKRNVIEKWTNHSHETSLLQIDSIVDNPERLLRVIMCIGRLVLSKIFERLVKNYKVYCSGFPDLIVWNFEAKKAKFVEVKGENDKLSIKQKLWLNYLLDIGADVQVCHVHSTGSKKKFKAKKDKSTEESRAK